jgi:hypothetical protein
MLVPRLDFAIMLNVPGSHGGFILGCNRFAGRCPGGEQSGLMLQVGQPAAVENESCQRCEYGGGVTCA